MFLENYRQDSMIGGQAQTAIPYPKISDEDWKKWKAFLPVKSAPFCKEVLLRERKSFLQIAYGIPPKVYHELARAAGHFEDIEIWGKREIHKDPIAVGIAGNGNRHLICRWGPDKLIPFETIKSRSWLYHIENFGVSLLASDEFWIVTAGTAVLSIAFLGLWIHA